MDNIFITILKMSLYGSIAALVVILARLCLRKAPKIFSYVLWLAVFFRLLCPISISVPIGALPAMPFEANAGSVLDDGNSYQPVIAADTREAGQFASPAYSGTEGYEPHETISSPPYLENVSHAQAEPPSDAVEKSGIPELLAYNWLTVTALMLCGSIWSYISINRKMRFAVRISDNTYESDLLSSAFVLGLFKPKIYIPTMLTDEQKRCIICHEQTHIRRFDYIIKYTAFIALAVHWFNPMVWLSYTMMCCDMEKSCDEAVIKRLTTGGRPVRSIIIQYSKTLLALAERNGLAAPVSFADNSIKGRMKNIMNIKPVKKHVTAALCVLCAAAMLLCMVSCVSSQENEQTVHESPVPEQGSVYTEEAPAAENTSYKMLTIGNTTFRSDVKELELSHSGGRALLTDISPIAECTSLERLVIRGNKISDISPLRGCTSLKELDLEDNRNIADLSVLSELKSLEVLNLSSCDFDADDLKQLDYFRGLPKLRDLGLGFSHDIDISLIECLSQLTSLRACIHSQSDIDALAKMTNAETLSLNITDSYFPESLVFGENGELTDNIDFSALTGLKSLSELTLEYNWTVTENTVSAVSEMSSLRSLTLSGEIAGEHAFSALSRLKQLEKLYVNLESGYPENGSDSLSCIGELTSLKALGIQFGLRNIDISELKGLDRLEELSLYGRTITGVDIINGFDKLTFLELPDCNIKGFYDIKWPSGLKRLDLCGTEDGTDGNGIDNISFLSQMSELEYLIFNPSSELRDISALSGLTKLRSLTINGDTMISDLSPLNGLDALEHLEVRGRFDDISALRGCSDMRYLMLYGRFDDISALRDMDKLWELSISSNKLSDISPVVGLPSLKNLYLEGNSISDISAIGECRGLYELCIMNASVTDTSPLRKLTGIHRLQVGETPINDISFISSMSGLEDLFLTGTKVSDISVLYELDKLKMLRLYNNRIDQDEIDAYAQTHPDCQMELGEGIG